MPRGPTPYSQAFENGIRVTRPSEADCTTFYSQPAQAEETAQLAGGNVYDFLAVGFRGRQVGTLPVLTVGERGGGFLGDVAAYDLAFYGVLVR